MNRGYSNSQKLRSLAITLRMIHQESARLEHGIRSNGHWESYIPTHFIYTFFTFNTLYSIDWYKSLERRRIWIMKDRDDHKINGYLDFCCQDEDFLHNYKEFFVKYIEQHCNIEKMIESFKNITREEIAQNDSVSEEDIANFKIACRKCFIDDIFDREILSDIITFIYKVRCNLFHGAKTLQELKSPSQQVRLDIYSIFLIAINEMVFSYIDHINGKDILEGLDKLIDELKWNRIEIF